MKIIKIIDSKRADIETVLEKVNGQAIAHTFTSFSDIVNVARRAERSLEEALIAKSRRPGAIYRATSGVGIANAHKSNQVGTHVVLERQTRGWALVDVSQATLYSRAIGDQLTLTQDQAAEAVANFSKRFTVVSAQATEPSPQP